MSKSCKMIQQLLLITQVKIVHYSNLQIMHILVKLYLNIKNIYLELVSINEI